MTRLIVLLACLLAFVYGWNKHMETPGLYQGDIQLSPEQIEGMRNGSHSFGSIVGRRWPGGKIAYVIENSIGSTGRKAIEAAIAEYHNV